MSSKTRTNKGPRVIVEFGDELARSLAADAIRQIVTEYILAEASVDTKTAAQFLGFSLPTFREHAKKIPLFEYSGSSHRYLLSELITYRNKHRKTPKN